MAWHHYFAGFWSGMFAANFVPHFVNGISGHPFPTPFAKPPGKGLSSPFFNVIWSLANLVIGGMLFQEADITRKDKLSLIIFFAGFMVLSLMLALRFARRDRA